MSIMIDALDSTFIETLDGESEEEWRRAVEQMLTDLTGRPNWWHPFSVGPTIRWSRTQFRSFRCAAGSVSCHLMGAAERNELPRALLVLGTQHPQDRAVGQTWHYGEEVIFDAAKVVGLRTGYDGVMTEAEWLAGNDLRAKLAFIRSKTSDRCLLLFAIACCRRRWSNFRDPRSRLAVKAAESYVEGGCSRAQLLTVAREAAAAWDEANFRKRRVLDLLESKGVFRDCSPEYRAARQAECAANPPRWLGAEPLEAACRVMEAACQAAGDESPLALSSVPPGRNPEREAQNLLLYDIFGNPFRPFTFDRASFTPAVTTLAQTIYDERQFDRTPELADAFEEALASFAQTLYDRREFDRLAALTDATKAAGRTANDILAHLHGPGPHVRGCWVLDLVLGYE